MPPTLGAGWFLPCFHSTFSQQSLQIYCTTRERVLIIPYLPDSLNSYKGFEACLGLHICEISACAPAALYTIPRNLPDGSIGRLVEQPRIRATSTVTHELHRQRRVVGGCFEVTVA